MYELLISDLLVSPTESEIKALLNSAVYGWGVEFENVLNAVEWGIRDVQAGQDNRSTNQNVQIALKVIQEMRMKGA